MGVMGGAGTWTDGDGAHGVGRACLPRRLLLPPLHRARGLAAVAQQRARRAPARCDQQIRTRARAKWTRGWSPPGACPRSPVSAQRTPLWMIGEAVCHRLNVPARAPPQEPPASRFTLNLDALSHGRSLASSAGMHPEPALARHVPRVASRPGCPSGRSMLPADLLVVTPDAASRSTQERQRSGYDMCHCLHAQKLLRAQTLLRCLHSPRTDRAHATSASSMSPAGPRGLSFSRARSLSLTLSLSRSLSRALSLARSLSLARASKLLRPLSASLARYHIFLARARSLCVTH